MISAVAAIGKNRVLGKNNELLWPIPDDLKRFKELTMGHPVIMGRKTFESILSTLKKPLPDRTNIVVTRSKKLPKLNAEQSEGEAVGVFCEVILADSVKDAIEKACVASGSEEIFIIGGAQIYEQALPFVDRLYLTLIEAEEEGDAFFPPYETIFTKKLSEESREHNGLKYKWVTLEK